MIRRLARRGLLAAILLTATTALAADLGSDSVRFRPVHVYVTPTDAALAAYQIEVRADGDAMIVGVEGGEHDAFATPPYYDPAALAGGRIIIAAFDTGRDLPTQRTRVATIHMRETGADEPAYTATLQAAGDADGRPIPATVELVPDEGDAP